jgi:post-segregation antitoxin (ccd killing protein)
VPKVSVYLPDELYEQVRARGLKLSALTQAAIERELGRDPNQAWVEAVEARPRRFDQLLDTSALLDEVREEFGR